MRLYSAIFSALTFVAGIGTARLLTAPTMAATPGELGPVRVAIAGGVAPAANAKSTGVCLPGFSASPTTYDPGDPKAHYTCASTLVTCPKGFALNSDSADSFGYNGGGLTYVCAKPAS